MKDSSPARGGARSSNEIHDEEEGLPLYEDLSGTSQLELPSKDATPAEVRAFLYQTLVSRHGLDEASARETANKWKLGGGAELRSYPLSLYTGIFGPEGSWVIYRSVNLMVQEEEKPQREQKLRNLHIGFGTGLGVLYTLSAILTFIMGWGWMMFAGICTPGALLIWYLCYSDMSKTSEEIVELKLKWFKVTDHTANAPPATGQPSGERIQ